METLKAKIAKFERQIVEIDTETLKQLEKDIENTKEQQREYERELKALKEGKQITGAGIGVIERSLAEKQNEIVSISNKLRDLEQQIRFKGQEINDAERSHKNREQEIQL